MATGTRKKLIEVAGDLFYRHGFQAVGLDQILNEVGITKTAFYRHFESKDSLILAVLVERDQRDVADVIEYMRTHGGTDPRRQIVALFQQLAQWFAEPTFRGCLFMNAATEFPSPNDPIHQAAEAHGQHLAGEINLRVRAAGLADADSLTRQIMMVMQGAIASRRSGGAGDAGTVACSTVATLLGVSATRAAS